jgi:hypothetical protein
MLYAHNNLLPSVICQRYALCCGNTVFYSSPWFTRGAASAVCEGGARHGRGSAAHFTTRTAIGDTPIAGARVQRSAFHTRHRSSAQKNLWWSMSICSPPISFPVVPMPALMLEILSGRPVLPPRAPPGTRTAVPPAPAPASSGHVLKGLCPHSASACLSSPAKRQLQVIPVSGIASCLPNTQYGIWAAA